MKRSHLELSRQEIQRYSRHLVLEEVGLAGQVKLKRSAVLLVGTGGLGSAIGTYLAAAGVGKIGVVDYDRVELTNLQRQILHSTADLGLPKVESARRRMLSINPEIHVSTYNTVFTTENAEEISAGYDILVDGTDNFPTRYLLNDLAVKTHKPFVFGSIYQFEGQTSVFNTAGGPCYRCLFPEPPPPGCVPSCAEGGVLGILPGTIGTLQATEVIKLILGAGESLAGKLLIYDALEMDFQIIHVKKNPTCKVCGENVSKIDLIDYEEYCGVPVIRKKSQILPPEKTISVDELEKVLNQGSPIQLVDVREAGELEISNLSGAIHIPLFELEELASRLEKNMEIVVFCRTGERSARAVSILEKKGFNHVKNLEGGINAWAASVDSSLVQY